MTSAATFRSFAGGEIAPAYWGRTDQTKYATGLRTLRNMLVMRSGGVTNRPGTVYVCPVKDGSVTARLIKFIVSDEQTYILEFGDRYIRFVQDGGQVVATGDAWVTATDYTAGDLVSSGGVIYYATADHTSGATTEPGVGTSWQSDWYALTASGSDGIYEVPSPYLTADLALLKVVQSADVMTIVHPSYAPMELRRYGHTRWILTAITIGPAITGPTGLGAVGGVAGADTYYAVTSVSELTSEESLASLVTLASFVPDAATPVVVSWTPVTGAIEYNVYRSTDGATYGFIGTGGGAAIPVTDSSWVTASATASTAAPGSWVAAVGQARNDTVALAVDKAVNGTYRILGSQTLTAAGSPSTPTEGRVRIYYSRDAEPRVDAGVFNTTIAVNGAGGKTVALDVSLPVPDNGYAALQIDLVPEVLGGSGGTLFTHQVTGTSVSWSKGATQFSDAAVTPDYTQSPPTQPSLFASADNYPSAVGYYQQRRLFGNTTLLPEKAWASAIGLPANFTLGFPVTDDDALSWTVAGRQINPIRHFLDLGKLIVFTASGEWTIEGDAAGILRPSEINPRQYSYSGSSNALPPIVVVNSALYVQARGTVVRDLMPDAIEGYRGNDLTLFATHLFTGYTLADWDFAQIPHSVVWAVRSDGTLLGLTYIKEQQVWGWHRHDTDGAVENVCVIPEGNEDRVYLIVRRTIDGATVRYIERLASRTISDIRDAVFMDCALSYDGRNLTAETMTLSGGTTWESTESLTVTRSVGGFVSGDVGNAVFFTAADGSQIRLTLTGYTSGTVMTGQPNRTVPADLRSAATIDWALAVDAVAGLDHLEGKAVAVLGDGYVVASPNNAAYGTVTVSGGIATLDQPYAVIHVGLPYLSDLQTLDLDTPQGASSKDRWKAITQVGAMLEATRGLWAGTEPPSDDDTDPLEGLEEPAVRDLEGYDEPTDLFTGDLLLSTDGTWTKGGRVFLRQVDPLPCTILSLTPQGFIPPGT